MTAPTVESPDTVQELRARYLTSLDTLNDASDRLVVALHRATTARDVAREIVQGGRPLSELEHAVEPLPLRTSLSEALTEFERTRHTSQRLLFMLLQSEGQTLADIGRTYGISRQLVSRLVNEPEPNHSA